MLHFILKLAQSNFFIESNELLINTLYENQILLNELLKYTNSLKLILKLPHTNYNRKLILLKADIIHTFASTFKIHIWAYITKNQFIRFRYIMLSIPSVHDVHMS